MAKNYVQEGAVIEWTNPGAAVLSGDVVVVGANADAVIAIALGDIGTGETGNLATEGVWDVSKVDAAVITAGEYVLFDSSAAEFDDNQAVAAAGDVADGVWAIESKGVTVGETIKVKLTGRPGVLS